MRNPAASYLARVTAIGIILMLAGVRHASAQTPVPQAAGPSAAVTPAVQDQLTVAVQISNGTPGSSLPASIPVRLYGYDGQTQAVTTDGTADASGKVRFDGVPYKNGRTFGLTAEVGRTTYVTALTPPKPGTPELSLSLTIYDTTTDASQVRVDQMYVVGQYLDETHLQITNAYVLSNSGNRTVEGGQLSPDRKAATLRFDLPKDASRVEYEANDGETYLSADGGFLFTRGVPPGTGTVQVAVRYTLPYSGQLHLDQGVRYPTQAVSVLWADQGVTPSGSVLKEQGTRSGPNGMTFRVYVADPVKAGASLGFDLSGTPRLGAPAPTGQPAPLNSYIVQTTASSARQDTIATLLTSLQDSVGPGLLISLFGIAVVIASALHWLFRRRAARLALDPVARQRALARALVDLEEDYSVGKLGEEAYAQRRGLLEDALAHIYWPGLDQIADARDRSKCYGINCNARPCCEAC